MIGTRAPFVWRLFSSPEGRWKIRKLGPRRGRTLREEREKGGGEGFLYSQASTGGGTYVYKWFRWQGLLLRSRAGRKRTCQSSPFRRSNPLPGAARMSRSPRGVNRVMCVAEWQYHCRRQSIGPRWIEERASSCFPVRQSIKARFWRSLIGLCCSLLGWNLLLLVDCHS